MMLEAEQAAETDARHFENREMLRVQSGNEVTGGGWLNRTVDLFMGGINKS